jgi:hypothetical protein
MRTNKTEKEKRIKKKYTKWLFFIQKNRFILYIIPFLDKIDNKLSYFCLFTLCLI